MRTLYYRDFAKTDDVAYNISRAMKVCREQGAERFVMEPGRYEIHADGCEERFLCISNHGGNGPKRVVFLIEDMQDFTLDLNGALLVCHGAVMPIAICRSQRITIQNMVTQNDQTHLMQARVNAHGEDWVDLTPEFGADQFIIRNGEWMVQVGRREFAQCAIYVEFNGETGEIEPGTADFTMGLPWEMPTEQLANGDLRMHRVTRKPPIGNRLIFAAATRQSACIFCEESSDLAFENIEIRSCFGMGLIAQACQNIRLDRFCTRRADGRLYTANADATHFVNCMGTVRVENSLFEGQLDDALNIHGIYTRIVKKTKQELFVRLMHPDAKGIRIFSPGDRIAVVHPETLLPQTEKTIREVEYLNSDVTRLVLEEQTDDVLVGGDVENLTKSAELIFRNNIVRNNRARGMLLASRARTLIENCFFHTAGCAVKFESDGAFWFESGCTRDVTIRGCTFDDCGTSPAWGEAVILCEKRLQTEENAYFHGSIRVENNDFCLHGQTAVLFDNVQCARFMGNRVSHGGCVTLRHAGESQLQPGIEEK